MDVHVRRWQTHVTTINCLQRRIALQLPTGTFVFGFESNFPLPFFPSILLSSSSTVVHIPRPMHCARCLPLIVSHYYYYDFHHFDKRLVIVPLEIGNGKTDKTMILHIEVVARTNSRFDNDNERLKIIGWKRHKTRLDKTLQTHARRDTKI